MHVRATDLILDEGRVFALPGDVGEVLDAETYEDGTRVVMVKFSGAPAVTTCFLGDDVKPMLAVVAPAAEFLIEPAPEPVTPNAPRRRGAVALGFVTSAAIAMALIVWRACPMPDAGTMDTQRTSQAPFLADVHGRLADTLFVGQSIPPAEAIPSDWSRPPCPKDPRVRIVQGLCFLSYGKPPCGVGYQHASECLIPIAKGKPLPAAILRKR